jgi:hypothetical protein
MRRYTPARNPIQALRERWGLGDLEERVAAAGEGPGPGVHPLPTMARQPPFPTMRPLPGVPDRPLFNPNQPSDAGSVDYAARQRSQLEHVPKGEQQSPITVYPAWESRLESMRDFLGVLRYHPAYTPIVATPGEFDLLPYTVPQGFTAFWKQFRFFFDPVPGVLAPSNTLITLLVDGLIVPDYFGLPLGPFMAAYQDCFPRPIAEGRQLSLRISITAAVGDIDTDVTRPIGLLYGNVRPRSGESEGREVGVRPPPLVIQPPPEPPEPPPPKPPPFQPPGPDYSKYAAAKGGKVGK